MKNIYDQFQDANKILEIESANQRLRRLIEERKVQKQEETRKRIQEKEKKERLEKERILYALPEARLGRIWKHFSEKPFFIISAYKKPEKATRKQNIASTEDLKQRLAKDHWGYIQLWGNYKYDDGTHGKEESLFVPMSKYLKWTPEQFKQYALDLCRHFGLKSIAYSGGGNDEQVHFLNKIGQELGCCSKLTPDKVADNYSRLRFGPHSLRTYVFESENGVLPVTGCISDMGLQAMMGVGKIRFLKPC